MANHIIPTQSKPIVPQEGWHVQHLFFSLNHTNWASMEEDQQDDARKHLVKTVERIRKHPDTQLLAFSMVGPKSDLGFMILTPDLQDADRFAKDLQRSLGPDVLVPAYSYLSMTELSEYTTKEEEFKKELVEKEGLAEGSEPFTARQSRIRRCSVRSWPGSKTPGCSRHSSAKTVLASRPPSASASSNGTTSQAHTSANGSPRVRQWRAPLHADGNGPDCHSRAVRSHMPAAAAAASIVIPAIRFLLSKQTCSSVTIGGPPPRRLRHLPSTRQQARIVKSLGQDRQK